MNTFSTGTIGKASQRRCGRVTENDQFTKNSPAREKYYKEKDGKQRATFLVLEEF